MGLNFEAYLNQLPEYNPAASPTTSQGDVQITPVNSVGIASISLRGLGPNRSLVLVNGKRTAPINALMVTDVNSIPSALVQRVETITGGASAVYGADAIGGVTNFILRDNFQGIADRLAVWRDRGRRRRGNAVVRRVRRELVRRQRQHRDRRRVLQPRSGLCEKQRLLQRALQRPVRGRHLRNFPAGHGQPRLSDPRARARAPINGVFFGGPAPAGKNVFSPAGAPIFRTFTFNQDGTVYNPASAAGFAKYNPAINTQTFHPYKVIDASIPYNAANPGASQVIDTIKWDFDEALVSAPQNRYSLFATGHYDLTDNLSFFARGSLAESATETSLFGTDAIAGWEAQVPYNPDTDSPLNPGINYNDAATVAAAVAAVKANIRDPTYGNPTFIPTGTAGAGHPVPIEVAALLQQPNDVPGRARPPRTRSGCRAGCPTRACRRAARRTPTPSGRSRPAST